MIARVTDPSTGLRVSVSGLRTVAAGLDGQDWRTAWYASTRHGLPVLRNRALVGGRRGGAANVRTAWLGLQRWAAVTGYRVTVETNRAEARALMAGGLVASDSGGPYAIGTGR